MLSILRNGERITDYSLASNYIYQRHLFAYHKATSLVRGNTIELGCGQGYGANLLSNYTPRYTAIDKTRPKETLRNEIKFIQAEMPRLSMIADDVADTVVCFQVIEHIKKDLFFLHEIRRILRSRGRLLLTTPNIVTTLSRNPFHIREYTACELGKLLGHVFKNCTIQGVYGNEKVMSYYRKNKKMVDAICRFDVLGLQHLLPSWILKAPYSILNNLNRLMLFQNAEKEVMDIDYSDFYLDEVSDDCLDFFCSVE